MARLPIDQEKIDRVKFIAGDIAERAPVEIGRRRPGAVEILQGLTAGDRIVVEGLVRVRPGTAVRVAGTRKGLERGAGR